MAFRKKLKLLNPFHLIENILEKRHARRLQEESDENDDDYSEIDDLEGLNELSFPDSKKKLIRLNNSREHQIFRSLQNSVEQGLFNSSDMQLEQINSINNEVQLVDSDAEIEPIYFINRKKKKRKNYQDIYPTSQANSGNLFLQILDNIVISEFLAMYITFNDLSELAQMCRQSCFSITREHSFYFRRIAFDSESVLLCREVRSAHISKVLKAQRKKKNKSLFNITDDSSENKHGFFAGVLSRYLSYIACEQIRQDTIVKLNVDGCIFSDTMLETLFTLPSLTHFSFKHSYGWSIDKLNWLAVNLYRDRLNEMAYQSLILKKTNVDTNLINSIFTKDYKPFGPRFKHVEFFGAPNLPLEAQIIEGWLANFCFQLCNITTNATPCLCSDHGKIFGFETMIFSSVGQSEPFPNGIRLVARHYDNSMESYMAGPTLYQPNYDFPLTGNLFDYEVYRGIFHSPLFLPLSIKQNDFVPRLRRDENMRFTSIAGPMYIGSRGATVGWNCALPYSRKIHIEEFRKLIDIKRVARRRINKADPISCGDCNANKDDASMMMCLNCREKRTCARCGELYCMKCISNEKQWLSKLCDECGRLCKTCQQRDEKVRVCSNCDDVYCIVHNKNSSWDLCRTCHGKFSGLPSRYVIV